MRYNRLSDVKPLKKCRKLKSLDACANRIKSLKGIENLSKIYHLRIGKNQLKDLAGIENLKKLKELDVSANCLTSLAGMENLKKIENLDISKNRLTSLKGIGQMAKLGTLYADENQLASVDELTSLKSIWNISVRGNRLSRLPDLRKFDGIFYFAVDFNYLSEQEIRAKFPTVIWDRNEPEYAELYEGVKSRVDYWIEFQNIDTEIELTEPSSVKQITKDTKKIAGRVHMKDAFIQFRCDVDYENEEAVIEARSDENGYFEFTDLDLKNWGGRPASICFGMRMDDLKNKKSHYYTDAVEKYHFTIKNK